jgi:hypothetical protein
MLSVLLETNKSIRPGSGGTEINTDKRREYMRLRGANMPQKQDRKREYMKQYMRRKREAAAAYCTKPYGETGIPLKVSNDALVSPCVAVAWRYRMADPHAAGIVINKAGAIDRDQVEASLRERFGREIIELEPCL